MASKKKKLTRRKKPTQARAVATVEAILQAATYILVEHGWDALTTNRVAERAGVNIASLYQYFPSKEAIVAELQRKHVQEVRRSLPKLSELQAKRSLRELLTAIVDASIREHRVAPVLHRVFADELPRSVRRPAEAQDRELDALFREAAEPFLSDVPNLDLASFVARVSLHALVHEAASERPALLEDPTFRDEVVCLLEQYLARASVKSTRRRGES